MHPRHALKRYADIPCGLRSCARVRDECLYQLRRDLFHGNRQFQRTESGERLPRVGMPRTWASFPWPANNRIPKREKTPLFASAADLWLAGKSGLAETSKQRYKECVAVLKEEFGKRLVCDFDGNDIAEYQRKRLAEGLSGRTVNYEVGSLRGILRQFGLWGAIADRVHSLPERHNVGRALSPQDQSKLVTAAGESRSPALFPLFLLSLVPECERGKSEPCVSAI